MASDIYLDDNGNPDYRRSVRESAISMGVDPSLAESMMRTESNGNANAQSPKGAIGLMQLMPATAQQYGVDPSDPAQNIEGGLKHIKYLMGKYKNNVPLAVAAYNAGEGNVDKFLKGASQLPAETQSYVQKITGSPLPMQNGQLQNSPTPSNPINIHDPNNVPKNADGTPASGWDIKQFLPNITAAATNPKNFPTIGGIAGGLVGSALTGGIMAPALAAMIGGGSGSAAQQQMENNTGLGTGNAPKIDPSQTAVDAATQGAWELGGQGIGSGLRRLGAKSYAVGAGLTRPGFSQNFPTAAQEGLEGGRLSLPILTSSGAQRVYERTAPQQEQIISRVASQPNAPLTSPIDVLRNGVTQDAKDMVSNATLPKDTRAGANSFMKDFVRNNSDITPSQSGIKQVTIQTPNGPSTIGVPYRTPEQVVPEKWDLTTLNAKKKGAQNEAQNFFKAANADRKVSLEGNLQSSVANSEKNILENNVPGLQQLNRKLQGQTGLNQSLNPSFRTPEELQSMGVSPEIAKTMTTDANRWTLARILNEFGSGVTGLGVAAGGHPLVGGAAYIMGHLAGSPFGQRVIGGTGYTLGRATPMLGRGIHIGANALSNADQAQEEDPQIAALKLAIANGQIK